LQPYQNYQCNWNGTEKDDNSVKLMQKESPIPTESMFKETLENMPHLEMMQHSSGTTASR